MAVLIKYCVKEYEWGDEMPITTKSNNVRDLYLGKKSALLDFYEKNWDPVYRFAKALFSEEETAENITCEAFEQTFRLIQKNTLDPVALLHYVLCQVALISLNSEPDAQSAAAGAAPQGIYKNRESIYAAIGQLPVNMQFTLYCYHMLNLSRSDMLQLTGQTESALEDRLRLIYQKLHQTIMGHGVPMISDQSIAKMLDQILKEEKPPMADPLAKSKLDERFYAKIDHILTVRSQLRAPFSGIKAWIGLVSLAGVCLIVFGTMSYMGMSVQTVTDDDIPLGSAVVIPADTIVLKIQERDITLPLGKIPDEPSVLSLIHTAVVDPYDQKVPSTVHIKALDDLPYDQRGRYKLFLYAETDDGRRSSEIPLIVYIR
jgi:DNA-directed RNA polymerase specialized sigma24 family protein